MSEVKLLTGHDQAWQLLLALDPDEVCARTGAGFDHNSGVYSLRSFGQDIHIFLEPREICGQSQVCDHLLDRTEHLFYLAILWYLISARKVPVSREMVRPSEINGGQIFVIGTHVLPVERIARKFGSDPAGFISMGKMLGGEELEHGDASIKLLPFPKLPVTLILWADDDEFPARADFFFHQGCDKQLPTDVLWSAAMATILVMTAGF